jgi:hypothetical protein
VEQPVGYDPFRLYEKLAAVSKSPHQEFAALKNKADACTFMARYGPLKSATTYPSPRDKGRPGKGIVIRLDDFWADQEEFRLVATLLADPNDPTGELAKFTWSTEETAFQHSPIMWGTGYDLLPQALKRGIPPPPQLDLDLLSKQPALEQIRLDAVKHLRTMTAKRRREETWRALTLRVGAHLQNIRPLLRYDEHRVPRVYWLCQTLRESLYLMLLIDLDRGKGNNLCEVCDRLFFPKRPEQRTCGGNCARLAAGRRYWQNKGKKQRSRRAAGIRGG